MNPSPNKWLIEYYGSKNPPPECVEGIENLLERVIYLTKKKALFVVRAVSDVCLVDES